MHPDWHWGAEYLPRSFHGNPRLIEKNFYEDELYIDRYYQTRFVCRAGKLKTKRNYKIISPMPDNFFTEMTVEEVCADAVEILVEKARGRTINLLWSGGIDSTVALYAFIRAEVPFQVHFDAGSITECETGYKDIMKHSLATPIQHAHTDIDPTSPLTSHICSGSNNRPDECLTPYVNDPNNFFVTGEVGDQIYGTGRVFIYDEKEREKCFRENTPERNIKILDKCVSVVLNTKNPNLKQWHWAWSFMAKYQYVTLRCAKQYNLHPVEPEENVWAFFDTPNWQRWSITHQTANSAWRDLREYKWASKKYIYESNGDAFYRDNKLKTPSANRERTKEGVNFQKTVTGLELNDDYIAVIKKTFGSNTPDVERMDGNGYITDEDTKTMV
jgi:hypothetical protein